MMKPVLSDLEAAIVLEKLLGMVKALEAVELKSPRLLQGEAFDLVAIALSRGAGALRQRNGWRKYKESKRLEAAAEARRGAKDVG